jgi:putative ABC transport system permease protein
LFENDFELVVGAHAARRYSLKLGQQVVGSHGTVAQEHEKDTDHGHDHEDEHHEEQHTDFPYTIVGILAPTGSADDRAMFTTLASYWKIHGNDSAENQFVSNSSEAAAASGVTDPSAGPGADQDVTLILVRTVRPLVLQLQQLLPRKFGVMAVRPGEVLQSTFTQVLQPIERVLLLYGTAIALVAAGSILTTLYLATLARRRDLAILRAIGALPGEIFGVVLLEALVLVTFGCGLGVPLSQAMAVLVRGDLEGRFGIDLQAFVFSPAEVITLIAIAGLGLAAALLPAWQAYRSEVASILDRGA